MSADCPCPDGAVHADCPHHGQPYPYPNIPSIPQTNVASLSAEDLAFAAKTLLDYANGFTCEDPNRTRNVATRLATTYIKTSGGPVLPGTEVEQLPDGGVFLRGEAVNQAIDRAFGL